MDASGDYVIAWEHAHYTREVSLPVGIGYGGSYAFPGSRQIIAQRFSHDGSSSGAKVTVADRPDLKISSTLIGIPIAGPAVGGGLHTGAVDPVDVAMDDAGEFVVAWGGQTELFAYAQELSLFALFEGGVTSIFARRYDAQGLPTGLPVTVDSTLLSETAAATISGSNSAPRVAMQPDGDYAVVWSRDPYPYSRVKQGSTIHAQSYTAAGRPRASISFPADIARTSSIAVTADLGTDYVVAWEDSTANIFGTRVTVAPGALGRTSLAVEPRFAVSTSSTLGSSFQGTPSVSSDGAGNTVFIWPSSPSNPRVFDQRFTRS
jgi:hypothetical protein